MNVCPTALWSLPLQFNLEVAEAGPMQPLVQIDLGHDDVAPILGFDEPIAGVVEDGGRHPE